VLPWTGDQYHLQSELAARDATQDLRLRDRLQHQRLRCGPYGDSTSCHGSTEGCGYDSQNVGLSQNPDNLNTGSNPYPGYVWWNTTTASDYCDSGAAGSGSFRVDSPSTAACWGVDTATNGPWYMPAVEFTTP
jgi:hypothetical protein